MREKVGEVSRGQIRHASQRHVCATLECAGEPRVTSEQGRVSDVGRGVARYLVASHRWAERVRKLVQHEQRLGVWEGLGWVEQAEASRFGPLQFAPACVA